MYLGQSQITRVVERVPASFIDAVESDPTMLEAFQPESGVTDLTLYDEAGDVVYAAVAPDVGLRPIQPFPQPKPPDPFKKPPPPPIIQPKPRTADPFVSISPVTGALQPWVAVDPGGIDPMYGWDIPEDVTEFDQGTIPVEYEERGVVAGFPWWLLLVAGGVYYATKKK